MDNDYLNDEEQPEQLIVLDKIFSGVVHTLENGRNDILEVVEECTDISQSMQLELEEVRHKTRQIIVEVDQLEKLERYARLRLVNVSRDFLSYTQEHIQDAYKKARELQMQLIDLRQQEVYLRRRRDELNRQIKKFEQIGLKANSFLQTTSLALKILCGNFERINDTLRDSYRQQHMVAWIIASQEAERRKIARDLHDGPAQSLASMLIRLDLVKRLEKQDVASIYEEIDNIKKIGRDILDDIRRVMFDLKPSLMNENNISLTLREFFNDYEDKYNFKIDFLHLGQDRRYDMSLEIVLFRLVQESITNIRKHAGVSRALVKLEDCGNMLTLVIKDEGVGFDLHQKSNKESYGILGMKERVSLLGGKLDIISKPGAGTQVIIRVPLEGESKKYTHD
ncbi:MAG: sensor histidine kinase [Syntrophomonadaceae bacterium]|jgi:two-component system sensor histidine kinase DegS